MWIGVLGALEVRCDACLVRIKPGKQQELLAVLAADAGRLVPAVELVDRLWGADPPASARTTLRGHVRRLRAALAPAEKIIMGDRGGYRLTVEQDAVDLGRFRLLSAQAAAEPDRRSRLDLLSDAVRLCRGRPFSGIEMGPWLADTLRMVEEEVLRTVEQWSDLAVEFGETGWVVAELDRQLQAHPYRESLWEQLLLALRAAGRTAEALMRYDEVRTLLADELGVDPSLRLRGVHQRLLSDNHSPAADRPLPAMFVGRAAELDRLNELCHLGRTVVLDGPAGIGKTALAAEWSRRSAVRFPGGVAWLNLRGFHPESPLSTADALRMLGSRVNDRDWLVVLDNARDANQVRPLLGRATTLVTSRRQLRGLVARDGAVRSAVPPLTATDARTLLPAMERVDEIVGLCAGRPLAIRILAEQFARLPGLDVDMVVTELRDDSKRLDLLEAGDDEMASMRSALARTQQLLGAPERSLLRWLAFGDSEFAVTDLPDTSGGRLRMEVRPALDTLVSLSIVSQRDRFRFSIDPLERAAARELAIQPLTVDADGAQLPVRSA